MTSLLTCLTLVAGATHILAEYRGWRLLGSVCKPIAMLSIIAMVLLGTQVYPYTLLIVIALVFSFTGDVFLMLKTRFFAWGLAAFLVAHLMYAVAFLGRNPHGNGTWLMLPLAAYGGVMWLLLHPRLEALKIPVAVYLMALLGMAWLAADWRLSGGGQGAAMAATGAMLFVISDSLLAVNRFLRPFHAAQLLVLGSYYTAQWLPANSS